ncbi:MAG: hypothetical protein C0506_10615 [Anaerolinea sp.]|nr:hypothetical protein [Anaerolinea sp.]
MQVTPYAADWPAPRLVELWALVRSTASEPPPVLEWSVYRPDGSLLAVIGGSRVPAADCPGLGATTVRGSMLEAAVGTGQLQGTLADGSPASITGRCADGSGQIYRGSLPLSHRSACGEYRFEAVAAAGAARATLAASFDDLCFTRLEIDFDRIEWGTIAPNQQTGVQGDLTWSPPSDSRPTIRNAGNTPAGVGIVFEQMKNSDPGATPAVANTLDVFDACLGKLDQPTRCVGDISAGTEAQPGREAGYALCPGELGRLDVLVRTPERGNEGRYTGQLRLVAHRAEAAGPGC